MDPDVLDLHLMSLKGCRVKISKYEILGKKMSIILYKMGEPELLLVVAMGCRLMAGPFSWKNAEVTINRPEELTPEATCCILDVEAGFALQATEVTAYRIPTGEFKL